MHQAQVGAYLPTLLEGYHTDNHRGPTFLGRRAPPPPPPPPKNFLKRVVLVASDTVNVPKRKARQQLHDDGCICINAQFAQCAFLVPQVKVQICHIHVK